jgi:hypothetical protein
MQCANQWKSAIMLLNTNDAKEVVFKTIVIGTCMFLMLSFAARIDIETQTAEEQQYCKMVSEKLWPDYKNTFQYC